MEEKKNSRFRSKLQDEPLSPATKPQSPRTRASSRTSGRLGAALSGSEKKQNKPEYSQRVKSIVPVMVEGFRFSDWMRRRIVQLNVTYHTRRFPLPLQLRLTLSNQCGFCRFNAPSLAERRGKPTYRHYWRLSVWREAEEVGVSAGRRNQLRMRVFAPPGGVGRKRSFVLR